MAVRTTTTKQRPQGGKIPHRDICHQFLLHLHRDKRNSRSSCDAKWLAFLPFRLAREPGYLGQPLANGIFGFQPFLLQPSAGWLGKILSFSCFEFMAHRLLVEWLRLRLIGGLSWKHQSPAGRALLYSSPKPVALRVLTWLYSFTVFRQRNKSPWPNHPGFRATPTRHCSPD